MGSHGLRKVGRVCDVAVAEDGISGARSFVSSEGVSSSTALRV